MKYYATMKPPKPTPCQTCPKFKLWRNSSYPYLGLHPKNILYIHLYYFACGDERLATMDGLYLMGTLDIIKADKALEYFADFFPTKYHRRWALEALWEIDKIASDVRGAAEAAQRLIAQRTAENKAKRRER